MEKSDNLIDPFNRPGVERYIDDNGTYLEMIMPVTIKETLDAIKERLDEVPPDIKENGYFSDIRLFFTCHENGHYEGKFSYLPIGDYKMKTLPVYFDEKDAKVLTAYVKANATQMKSQERDMEKYMPAIFKAFEKEMGVKGEKAR